MHLLSQRPEFSDRKFLDMDMDNFENRMAAINPAVTFRVNNKLSGSENEKMGVKLEFSKMEDFSPASVAKQVPALNTLLEARTQLSNLLRYMDGKVSAEDVLKKLLADPSLMAALKDRQASEAANPSNEV